MELDTYFFDTYAFYELVQGNPDYLKYSKVSIITSKLNLMEFFYGQLIKAGQSQADRYYTRFLPFCVELDDETIKEAMIFRSRNKKRNLSYVDCIGYLLALKRRAIFLTGDSGFRGFPGVEFVK